MMDWLDIERIAELMSQVGKECEALRCKADPPAFVLAPEWFYAEVLKRYEDERRAAEKRLG